MTKITCDMCMDLMPLVQDGVASEDSIEAVELHMKSCPVCREMFEGQIPASSDSVLVLKEIQRKLRIFVGMVLMFGVFFGLSLTASNELFLNILIMPIIGCIGYYLFGWKGIYTTPCLLFVTHLITNGLGLLRGTEHLDIPSLLLWSGLYSLFVMLGTVIAGLLHFAFRKEK